eukprot:2329082-Pyramimonas_sp.AAC.2
MYSYHDRPYRYNSEFDERDRGTPSGAMNKALKPNPQQFDPYCKWPMPADEIWQYFLEFNKKRAAPYKRNADEKVISFSHFLPRSGEPRYCYLLLVEGSTPPGGGGYRAGGPKWRRLGGPASEMAYSYNDMFYRG